MSDCEQPRPKHPTVANEAVQVSERTQEHLIDHVIDLVDPEAAHIPSHPPSQQSIQTRETAAVPSHRHPDQRSDLAIKLLVTAHDSLSGANSQT
jgi:hypothetical protein